MKEGNKCEKRKQEREKWEWVWNKPGEKGENEKKKNK